MAAVSRRARRRVLHGIRLSTLPDVAATRGGSSRRDCGRRVSICGFSDPSTEHTPGLLARARNAGAGAGGSARRVGRPARRGAPTARPHHRRARTVRRAAAALFHRLPAASSDPTCSSPTPLVVLEDSAARPRARRRRTRHPQRLRGRQLGPSVEQGGAELRAAARVRLERHPETGGRRAAPASRRTASSVTGAHVFDDWFGRKPSTTREAVLRTRRSAPRPTRSSCTSVPALLEGSPPEAPFVLRWVRHLRQSGHPVLRDCGILIRPHFRRGREWRATRLSGPRQRRLLAAARRCSGRRPVRRTTTSTRCTTPPRSSA